MVTPVLLDTPSFNREKYEKMWLRCQKQGHKVIFNSDEMLGKLRQFKTLAANLEDLMDDLFVSILVCDQWLKVYGYSELGSIREEIRRFKPEMPPERLLGKYQNQEIRIRQLAAIREAWFGVVVKYHKATLEESRFVVATLTVLFEETRCILSCI